MKSFIQLSSEIEQKREEMIKLAKGFGLSNKQTIKASQELDILINIFNIAPFTDAQYSEEY
ncbi:Spo0E family sporulation regulatory protein-aspartic acid phosphatase [Peribacillus loiseleuriae]|uniref:Spo0E family sporulation regulatory protein-aspartic acid phosphatase n=1 Tax=Peribacillus loiseleuriae TaxID=1679170 RepID=UPI0037FBDDE4